MCEWMEKNGIGSRRFVSILGAGLIATLMAIASSAPSTAQEANRVVSNCNFDLNMLKSSLTSSDTGVSNLLGSLQAVAIVIYANNPNFGQPVPNSNPTTHTGRVVCMVDGVTGNLKAETDPIPGNGGTADINDVGNGMALRYTTPSGSPPSNGIRICATSNGNGDCVDADLSPVLP